MVIHQAARGGPARALEAQGMEEDNRREPSGVRWARGQVRGLRLRRQNRVSVMFNVVQVLPGQGL